MVKPLIFLICLSFSSFVAAQDTLTLVTYNALRFSSDNTARAEYFRTVFDYIKPDIILLNELESEGGLNTMLALAFNYNNQEFSRGSLPSRSGLKSGLIYRNSAADLIVEKFIPTELRHINGYTLSLKKAHGNVPLITFFTGHLKAGDSEDEAEQRWREISELARYIDDKDDDYHYVVSGDFNIYGPSEKAYLLLRDSLQVNLVDPLWDSQKPWERNKSSFVNIYTQSTRTQYLPDGGATGGLDDRFDYLLFSHQFFSNPDIKILDDSYQPVGNDGQHFNQALTDGANNAVPENIAAALYGASDHLPVVTKLIYTSKTSTSPVAFAGTDMVAEPNDEITLDGSGSYDSNGIIVDYLWAKSSGPVLIFNDSTLENPTFSVPDVKKTTVWTFKLKVTDNDGETGTDFVNIKVNYSGPVSIADVQTSTLTGFGEDCYPSPRAGEILEVAGIVTGIVPGEEFPKFFIQDTLNSEWGGLFVYGESNFITPSVGDEVLLKGLVSEYYGLTELKNIQNIDIISTKNLSGAITIDVAHLQGACTVWGEALEGMLVQLVNVNVSRTANQYNEWRVKDWSGSCLVDDYLYEGEWPNPQLGESFVSIKGVVTYSFGEYRLLPRNENDFNEPVTAVFSDTPAEFLILNNYPNPFNPVTTVQFSLDKSTNLQLEIFDIRGRKVKTLLKEFIYSGIHEAVWRGRDDNENILPAGIYFARLKTSERAQNHKMIFLK